MTKPIFLTMVDADGQPAHPGNVAGLLPGAEPWPPQTPAAGILKETGPDPTGRHGLWVMCYEWVVGAGVYHFSWYTPEVLQPEFIVEAIRPRVIHQINISASYEAKRK